MTTPDDVTRLIQALSGRDFEAAQAARDALQKLGADALPGLIALIGRDDLPNLALQWEAATALESAGEAALPALYPIMTGGASGARWAAGEAITYIGAPSVPGLAARLRDPDVEVRQIAVYGLIYCGDARAVPALLEAMRDGDPDVRLGAMKALRRIADPTSELPMRAALYAGVTPRTALIWALEGVMEESLLRMLDDLHDQTEAGQEARTGVRRIWEGEPARLLRVLKDSRYVMRARAADALAQLRDPAAVPALLDALNDPVDMVRGHAANALGQIGDRQAVAPLMAMLGEPDMLLRWTAAEALGHLRDPQAVMPLLEAWINADHELMLSVTAEAVQRIGEPAHAVLREALDDPREDIARAARYMIGQLGAPQ